MTYDTEAIGNRGINWAPAFAARCGCKKSTIQGVLGANCGGYFIVWCSRCKASWAWRIT